MRGTTGQAEHHKLFDWALGAALAVLLCAPSALAQTPRAPGQPVAAADGFDPPERVGRVSHVEGTVSYHTLDMEFWERADLNFPVKGGDTFWTEPGARASLEFGGGVLRLDSRTEVEILRLEERLAELSLPRGAVNLRLRWVDRGEVYRVVSPGASFELTRAGRYHIDVYDDGRPARLAVLEGAADIILESGVRFVAQDGEAWWADPDQRRYPRSRALIVDLDRWSDEAEGRVRRAPSYVARDIPGVHDLGAYGEWDRHPDHGAIWYPSVAFEWVPYRFGHWAYVAPWGWTWIDHAPWGFAPFHYGRWTRVSERWAWVPGHSVYRPVYAPALVVFIGTPVTALTYGTTVAWIPLGPREIYVPPYKTSIAYVRNVNVTHVTNVTNITINTVTANRNASRFALANQRTVVRGEAMTRSASVDRERIEARERNLDGIDEVRVDRVKPTLATRGASKAVVAAVGGDVTAPAPEERRSRGPSVRPKAPPEALLRPLAPAEDRPERRGVGQGPREIAPQIRREPAPPRAEDRQPAQQQLRREREAPRPADVAPQPRREPAEPQVRREREAPRPADIAPQPRREPAQPQVRREREAPRPDDVAPQPRREPAEPQVRREREAPRPADVTPQPRRESAQPQVRREREAPRPADIAPQVRREPAQPQVRREREAPRPADVTPQPRREPAQPQVRREREAPRPADIAPQVRREPAQPQVRREAPRPDDIAPQTAPRGAARRPAAEGCRPGQTPNPGDPPCPEPQARGRN